MLRPSAFQNPHIVLRNLPYLAADETAVEAPALGGVLGCGQTVWTAETFTSPVRPRSAVAFIEGIGKVRIDPRWIAMRSDGALAS